MHYWVVVGVVGVYHVWCVADFIAVAVNAFVVTPKVALHWIAIAPDVWSS